jgi:hypothetical protein
VAPAAAAVALLLQTPLASAQATGGSACRFLTAGPAVDVAFCDSFDTATPDPSTRAGDLDAEVWGVSRTNTAVNLGQGQYNDFYVAHLVGCGGTQAVLPSRDVRICGGRLLEAVADNGGQPVLAMYPKQPFDFAGRTGTVVFDVSSDSDGPHAAWPEFWITDKPVPAPRAGVLPAQRPYARHSFGFELGSDYCGDGQGVHAIGVTRNYVSENVPFTRHGCVTRGSATGALNHFEVRLSQDRVEIWGSDAGSASVRLLASASDLRLSFTRGLIWIEHVGYNACKFGSTQCDHTFAWDNVGFDGPKTYRDLSFDVQDALVPVAGGVRLGWSLTGGVQLTVPGVFRKQPPTGAIVTFNWFPYTPVVPSFRVNGGPLHVTPWPFDGTTFAWRTIDVPVPLSEVRDGANTIEFGASQAVLSNVNLILIAAGPVPQPTEVSFESTPTGVPITVNGQPLTTPATLATLSGTRLVAVAPRSFTSGGLQLFSNWGEGLEPALLTYAPSTPATFTARYQPSVDSGPLGFHPVTPCRLIDTRERSIDGAALEAGSTRVFAVARRCGLPPDARTLSATITGTAASSNGHLRVYPADQLVPGASALNVAPGVTRANNAVIPLSPTGEFAVRTVLQSGSLHLIVDVNGFYR